MHFSNKETSLILSSGVFLFLTKLYTEGSYSEELVCHVVRKEENSFSFPSGVFKGNTDRFSLSLESRN